MKESFLTSPKNGTTPKEAYNIRSSILHEGIFDADLVEKVDLLENILRHIYSQILEIDN